MSSLDSNGNSNGKSSEKLNEHNSENDNLNKAKILSPEKNDIIEKIDELIVLEKQLLKP